LSNSNQNTQVEDADIEEELVNATDKRIFAIGNAFHRGYSVEKIHDLTNIDLWFLRKLEGIVNAAKLFAKYNTSQLPPNLLRQAKQLGYSDRQLAKCLGSTELAVRRLRQENAIFPFVKQIDTVAAEFPAYTNYLCEAPL